MKRVLGLASLLASLAACASGGDTDVAEARAALTARPFLHVTNERAVVAVTPARDTVASARAIVSAHAASLGLRRPPHHLARVAEGRDELGMQHTRLQQFERGLRVIGAEVLAHHDRRGVLTSLDATLAAVDELDVTPATTADDAKRGAILAAAEGGLEADGAPEPELAIDPNRGEPKLVWHFEHLLNGGAPVPLRVDLDAHDAHVISRFRTDMHLTATGKGIHGDTKSFEVASAAGGYEMRATIGGVPVVTEDAKNDVNVIASKVVWSSALDTWDTEGSQPGAAVDAHANVSSVVQYFLEHHARRGIDGKGGTVRSIVRFDRALDNAFFQDGSDTMVFGDGAAWAASLGLTAHEMSHGVTSYTSKLEYRDEPGALNEAFSDIMAAFVTHAVMPAADPWAVGTELYPSRVPLRDMRDPNTQFQPAAMTQYVTTTSDNGGVHINSGIVNQAAYLMTVGGVNPVTKVRVPRGIGWEKAEKVWYRANTKYFLERTDFALAVQGVLEAAKDLELDETELGIVACSFTAVGLSETPCPELASASVTTPEAPPPPATTTRTTTSALGCAAGGRPTTGSAVPILALAALVARLSRRARRA